MRRNSWITLLRSLGGFGLAAVLCLVSGTGTIARAEESPAISDDDWGYRECVDPIIEAFLGGGPAEPPAIGCLFDENDTVLISFKNRSLFNGDHPCDGEILCECPPGTPLSETCFDLQWDFMYVGPLNPMSTDPWCIVQYEYTHADYLSDNPPPHEPAVFDVALRVAPILPHPPDCPECYQADTVIREALVKIYLQPHISIIPEETSGCADPGTSVTIGFCDESSGDYTGVLWHWPDGDELTPPDACPTHSFDAPTGIDPEIYVFTVELIQSEESPCDPQSQTITVSIYPDQVVSVDADPAAGCCDGPAGLDVTFDPVFTGGLEPTSCVWEIDGVVQIPPPGCDEWTYTFPCPPAGTGETHTIEITANYGPEGCDPATGSTTVEIWAPPVVTCDVQPRTVCTGAELHMTGNVTAYAEVQTTCEWLFDGDQFSPPLTDCDGGARNVPPGTPPAIYPVTLRVSTNGCDPVDCTEFVTVVEGPTCEVDPSTTEGCGIETDPLRVHFDATIGGSHGPCRWYWGDGTDEPGCESKDHDYWAAPGTQEVYHWRLVVDALPGSGCEDAICEGDITVYGPAIPACNVEPQHFCVPQEVTLHNTSTYGNYDATACQWFFDDAPISCDTCAETCVYTVPAGTDPGEHIFKLELITGPAGFACDPVYCETSVWVHEATACVEPAGPVEICVENGCEDFTFTNCSTDANHCEWWVNGALEQTDDCTETFTHCFQGDETDQDVTLKARSNYPGCDEFDEVSVVVKARPGLHAGLAEVDCWWEGEAPNRCAKITVENTSTPAEFITICGWEWEVNGHTWNPDLGCDPTTVWQCIGEDIAEPGDIVTITLTVDDGDEICPPSTAQIEVRICPRDCIPVYVGSGFFDPGELIRVPIKTDEDLAGCDIESFEFTVQFCDDMMEMIGTSTVGSMLGEGETVAWNLIQPGIVRVAWAGVYDLIGPGAFVYLEFQTFEDIDCGDGCVIRIVDGALNENVDCPMCDDPVPGLWQVPWHDIAGTVTYYSCDELDDDPANPRPIPSATVHALGCDEDHELHAPVGPTGTYVMRGCPGCDYCLTVTKEPETDPMSPAITSYDAALVLQAVVEMIELDNCPIVLPWCPPVPRPQEIVADVSDNGTVTAFDAALILKCIVGHPEAEDALCGQWDFFCPEVCTDGLYADWFVDFVGILYGDVSGNWYQGIDDADAGQLATADIGYLHVPPVTLEPRGQLVVPLALSDAPEVLSAFIDLSYDTEHMTLANISSGDMGGDCLLEFYDDGGDVRVAIACEEKFAAEGTLLNLVFKVASTFGDHAADVLTVNSWMLDEQVSAQAQIDMPLALQTVTAAVDYTFALSGVRPIYEGLGGTHVEFSIPSEGRVSLKVYDLQGSRVRTLVDHSLAPGRHTAQWDWRSDAGAVVASGVYFVKLEYSGQALRSKMLVVQ